MQQPPVEAKRPVAPTPQAVKGPEPRMPDLDLELAKPAAAPAAPAREFNLADFNLDTLAPIGNAAGAGAGAAKPAAAGGAADFNLDLKDLNLAFGEPSSKTAPARDDHWHDVQQKFDLAKAYEQMGDKEGARDILQEVLKEGDPEQQAQAKKLLAPLG